MATMITGAIVAGLTISGAGSELLQKAQAASNSSTPYTDASQISYGVLNGCGSRLPAACNSHILAA